ncbi:hypothetical protein Tsubulata_025322 [Turnera subulata]|uniref:Bromo domain-containing protein n=1 Tax=Turnera subulata TaxID=218843 RepID=A0A9Q0FED8_9ROSI|nr:hypothetical protein Tsubulata_025322 [Turnera subulata]
MSTTEEAAGHRRRSARIWELEEKAKALSLENKHTINTTTTLPPPPPSSAKRRGRKRKSLLDVVQQEGENPKHDGASSGNVKTANLSLQQIPSKQTLEFVLDILQRRDKQELFAQPVDPEEVVGYYDVIKEPMDFGTMRAKLQEEMYTSLEQFERDVFLICSNAMRFNSSTTVYYSEARAISELGRRVLHLLRTEPESFKLEYSRTRKRSSSTSSSSSRKPHNEAARTSSSRGKLDHRSSSTSGITHHDHPSIDFTSQTFLPSSRKYNLTGSRDGGSLNPSSEAERRLAYMPWKDESIISDMYNAPKQLSPVAEAGMRYAESLLRFVKGLGPTAQTVALAKLGKLPIWRRPPPPLIITPSCAQTSFGKKPLQDVPPVAAAAPLSSLTGFAHPIYSDVNISDHQMPRPFSSSKGKAAYNTERDSNIGMIHSCINADHDKGKAIATDHSTLNQVRPNYPTNINGGHSNLLEEEKLDVLPASRRRLLDAAVGSSSGKTVADSENMDLLIATIMQINAFQNRHTLPPSSSAPSSYFPDTSTENENEGLHVPPSQLATGSSQLWMQNEYPNLEATNISGTSQVINPVGGFNQSQYPPNGGELGPTTFAAPVLHPPMEWNQLPVGVASWGSRAENDLPISMSLSRQFMDKMQPSGHDHPALFLQQQHQQLQISSFGQNAFLQQQISPAGHKEIFMQQQPHISQKHEMPFFDALSLLEGAKPSPGNQAADHHVSGTTPQRFWDTQALSLMDGQNPDLALQL